MGKYKIGKDVGRLTEHVKMLEKKTARCKCEDTKVKNDQRGVSDSALFESLYKSAHDEETFEILKRLVTDVEDVTIRELFACSIEDVGKAASDAIMMAKTKGFIRVSNDHCGVVTDDLSVDDYCKHMDGKWCSIVKAFGFWRCSLASDKC